MGHNQYSTRWEEKKSVKADLYRKKKEKRLSFLVSGVGYYSFARVTLPKVSSSQRYSKNHRNCWLMDLSLLTKTLVDPSFSFFDSDFIPHFISPVILFTVICKSLILNGSQGAAKSTVFYEFYINEMKFDFWVKSREIFFSCLFILAAIKKKEDSRSPVRSLPIDDVIGFLFPFII